MATKTDNTLTQAEINHFIEKGHIILRDCFPRELAAEWREFAYKRLGYAPDSSLQDALASGLLQPRMHLPSMNRVPIKAVAPRAWRAICELLGGEARIGTSEPSWGDGFIINFALGADSPWQPPSPEIGGWHKDGDFFRHFLDSPEQGLLTIVVWSDIYPKSGGTFVACDSVQHVARRLYEHPEGLLPSGFGGLIDKCEDFVEITGQAGDVVLLHPFILHAASQNPSGRARFITNPPVHLKEPMNFNRENPDDFSPVELGVLHGLEKKRLDFKPTVPRERLVPERIKRQQKMLEEQKRRLETE